MSGNKNTYIQRRQAVNQAMLDAGEQLGIQKMWDYIQIALRDPEVMGKDVLGRKRLEKLYQKTKELADYFHTAFTDDVEADHRQEEMDAALREIWGETYPHSTSVIPSLRRLTIPRVKRIGGNNMDSLPKNAFYGMTLDEEQAAFVKAIKDLSKTIVFCNAKAGTGKTTLAMGAANILVKDKRNNLDGIVYIVSPYGEDKQGYLPGSITEKSEVYYEPAYQAMIEVHMNPNSDVYSEAMTSRKRDEAFVKLLTHTYLRGTNLQNKVVILDESQNYTVAELKKVLTRCHDTCKVIVIGHTGQIDIRGGSGFQKYLEHFEGHEKCAVCKLTTNHRGWLSTFADELED